MKSDARPPKARPSSPRPKRPAAHQFGPLCQAAAAAAAASASGALVNGLLHALAHYH